MLYRVVQYQEYVRVGVAPAEAKCSCPSQDRHEPTCGMPLTYMLSAQPGLTEREVMAVAQLICASLEKREKCTPAPRPGRKIIVSARVPEAPSTYSVLLYGMEDTGASGIEVYGPAGGAHAPVGMAADILRRSIAILSATLRGLDCDELVGEIGDTGGRPPVGE